MFSLPLNLHLFVGKARIVEGTEPNKNKSQPITNGNILLLMWLEALHLNVEGVQCLRSVQSQSTMPLGRRLTEKAMLAFSDLNL